jgi:alginate O-acetyltransferase complex protein AlgI
LLFTSAHFAVFTSVFAVYWMVPGQQTRLLWLLAASVYFYASWNPWLVGLIVASTTVDYWIARTIAVTRSPRGRSALTAALFTLSLLLAPDATKTFIYFQF